MIFNIFKKIFSQISRRDLSSANCSLLLELPPELVLYITEFLESGADKICLASTCRALHGFLNYHISSLPLEQKQDAAHQLQLDWLGRWHCGLCHKFHSVDLRDTPVNPTTTGCSASSRKQDLYTALGSYLLVNRHITQALKYNAALVGERRTTLSRSQSKHLSKLLAPHHTTAFLSPASYLDFFTHVDRIDPALEYWHSVFPKIVQGRFLLMSLWIYHGTSKKVFQHRDSCVCKHQFISQSLERIGQGESFSKPQHRRVSCFDDLKNTRIPLHPNNSKYWFSLLFNVEHRALNDPGVEVCGSCPFCPTDFAVKRYSAGRIVYCSWQDMGSLAMSEGHSARQVFAWDHTGPDRVWHPEGSVRAMYHSCGDDSIRSDMGLSSTLPPKFDLERMAVELEESRLSRSARFKPLMPESTRCRTADKSYTRLNEHQDSWRCWIENPTGSPAIGAEQILPVADESKNNGNDKNRWLGYHGITVVTEGRLPRQQSPDDKVSIQLGEHSSGQGAALGYANDDNPGSYIQNCIKRGNDIQARIEDSISIVASIEERIQSGMVYSKAMTDRLSRAREASDEMRSTSNLYMLGLRELNDRSEDEETIASAEQHLTVLDKANNYLNCHVRYLAR